MTLDNKKRSSTDILKDSLSVGFPGGDRHNKNAEIAAALFANEHSRIVTLSELKPSKVLPRIKRNEKYDDIKASIRIKGLDQPPPITMIPGDDIFTISDGGNTRLQILNELYEETGDDRFFKITCLYKPWKGKLKSIVGHLVENELRSDFTFIEKAIGVSESKHLFEEELGLDKPLSLRDLSEKLKEEGYPVSPSILSRMLSTVNLLYPHIPEVLASGLGKPQIEKILQLRSICEERFKAADKEKTAEKTFDNEFGSVLAPFDIEYSYERLQDEMFDHFSKMLDMPYNHFEFDLDQKNNRFADKTYPLLPPVETPHQNIVQPIMTDKKTSNVEKIVSDNDTKRQVTEALENNDNLTSIAPVNNVENTHVKKETFVQDNANPKLEPTSERLSSNERDDVIHISGMPEDVVKRQQEDIAQAYKLMDLEDEYPSNYSLTAGLKTNKYEEYEHVVHVWKIKKTHYSYASLAGRIYHLVYDIINELNINVDCLKNFDLSLDDDTVKHRLVLEDLSQEDKSNPLFVGIHTFLRGLLDADHDHQFTLNSHWLISSEPLLNDYLVLKIFRLIRLKREYDKLVSSMTFTSFL